MSKIENTEQRGGEHGPPKGSSENVFRVEICLSLIQAERETSEVWSLPLMTYRRTYNVPNSPSNPPPSK